MDVLLINPKNITSRLRILTPPLGLASIGCILEKEGLSVSILDLELEPNDFDISSYIKTLSPKIIGVSGTSHSRFESFNIANIAKQVSPKIITVYGGCHASFTAVDTLNHIKDIDYIVRGEGEITFLELVRHLILKKGDISNIKGVTYRKNGAVIHNEPRGRIIDLDSIPYSRHLLKMERYNVKLDFLNLPATSIITARGCPYNCYFCSAGAMFGTVYTKRSPKNIADEIQYCVENFGIKGVKFFDSTFTLIRGHVLSVSEELIRRRINLPWECEISVNSVDKSLLYMMKKAGCYFVDFGVESVSSRVLRGIGKKINTKQVKKVFKWCKELDIKTKVFFSFGHIKETPQDALKTLSFIERYKDYIDLPTRIWGIRIYPGTRLEKYARDRGLLPKKFSWSEPFSSINEDGFFADSVPKVIRPSFNIKDFKRVREQIKWIREISLYRKNFTIKNIFNTLKEDIFSGYFIPRITKRIANLSALINKWAFFSSRFPLIRRLDLPREDRQALLPYNQENKR
jgi:radical SAM superfamily enzyme YgiQ (UPF0313 family)